MAAVYRSYQTVLARDAARFTQEAQTAATSITVTQ